MNLRPSIVTVPCVDAVVMATLVTFPLVIGVIRLLLLLALTLTLELLALGTWLITLMLIVAGLELPPRPAATKLIASVPI